MAYREFYKRTDYKRKPGGVMVFLYIYTKTQEHVIVKKHIKEISSSKGSYNDIQYTRSIRALNKIDSKNEVYN